MTLAPEGTRLRFATFTAESVGPQNIRSTASKLRKGFNAMMADDRTRHRHGYFQWLEIKADEHRPWLENVHLHSVLALKPSHFGKNYLSADKWDALWRESTGSICRDAQVESVQSVQDVGGYICRIDKFVSAARSGIQDPERFLLRAEQLKSLPRYVGKGVLGDGEPDELLTVCYKNWKSADRRMTRRVHDICRRGHYESPIKIEQPVNTVQTDFAHSA